MNAGTWIIIILLIVVIVSLFLMNKNAKQKQIVTLSPVNSQGQTNSGYALGFTLANLIQNTQCGKNGRPPCTVSDLEEAGWSQEQINTAQEASQTVSNLYLCTMFGIGC